MRNLTHIPDHELTLLKTKLRSTCEKYSKINVPYKYEKVIDNPSKNKNIVILKQCKERGIIIIVDTIKYIENYMALLNAQRFKKVTADPTEVTEKDKKSFEKNKI